MAKTPEMNTAEAPALKGPASKNLHERGIGSSTLKEQVPDFVARSGDHVITAEEGGGTNNNAWIVLGRDRYDDTMSGYGGRGSHGAGAIDIVVGRGAPRPVKLLAGSKMWGLFDDDLSEGASGCEKLLADPSFITKRATILEGVVLGTGGGAEELQTKHPGFVMDAARIYISQMCNIDYAFGLVEGLSNPSPEMGNNPASAIGLKADDIRLHSRRGMKLVTGGKLETHDSQGGRINATYGIELIAGNGYPGSGGELVPQEPLVKGRQLLYALDKLVDLVDQLTGIVATIFQVQTGYNIVVGNHWHPELILLGFPGMPSPVLTFAGLPVFLIESMAKVMTSFFSIKANMALYHFNHLNPASENMYINSRWNTTN